jgi:sigma-B regulation protein RsbU (phosphoserine phosphatase)
MNILLVNNDKKIICIQELWLLRMGHTVKKSKNGSEAWSYLMKYDFQIIICDEASAIINGVELFKKIRNHIFPHYIYLILLLSDGKDAIQSQSLKSGSDDFISKPFSFEIFHNHIESAQRIIDLEKKLTNQKALVQTAYDNLSKVKSNIDNDLEHAASLQRALCFNDPGEIPAKLSCYYSPVTEVGGDTLNYIKLSKDIFFFYAIDVSGHGISSAMMSVSLGTMLHYLLKEYLNKNLSNNDIKNIPLEITNHLNTKLNNDDHIDHYFTMLSGIVDNRKNKIYYVQAGHPFPILYHCTSHTTEIIETNGFPVGLLKEASYDLDEINFDHNDRLLIYSDGIFELKESNELLDQSWLKNIMDNISNYSFNDASKYINKKLDDIIEQKTQKDDISLLLVELN